MWNSQLEQHLDQFHDDDSTSIEEQGDYMQHPMITVVSRQDDNSSSQQKKRENEETSPSIYSKRTISHTHPSHAMTRATMISRGFDHVKERRSAGLFTVFLEMATIAVVAVAGYLSETTTATAAVADGTCSDSGRNIILTWLCKLATLLCTFLAGWHGGKISIGGDQSSHHEAQKSVRKSDAVVHSAVKEESWNEKVDDEIFISKSPPSGCPSCRHQLRLRLVELLGTIGAPPFVLEQDETHHNNNKGLESGEESLKNTGNQASVVTTKCCTYDNSCQQHQEHQYDQLLIEFCEALVEWIQTLDQALDLLRASTSIQFGGSILRNNVVERIERAAVGRWRRCQRQVTTTTTTRQNSIVTPPPLHLPLARIRRRVAEALQRQAQCLEAILRASYTAGEVEEEEEEGYFENEEIPCDDIVRFKAIIDMNVITIQSLRLARDDIAVLLARIVDQSIKNYTSSTVASFSGYDCTQQLLLQQATQRAREEEAYLSACSRFTPSLNNDDDEDNEGVLAVDKSMLNPLKQSVVNLQMTASSLQVALLSFQDAVLEQQQNAEPGGREIIKDWWQRVDSLSRTMLAAKNDVEQVVLQPTSTSRGGSVDEESSDDNAIGGAPNNPTDVKQDFVADAAQAVTTRSPTTHHDELHSSKTLLFSGSGTVVIRKEKRFEKTTKCNNTIAASYSASTSSIVAAEQSLIHELETYLRCMPAPEEVNVTESTAPMNIPNDGNENSSVLNAATTSTIAACNEVGNDMEEDAADQPCGLLSILPTQHHGLFLGELTSSIQKHSNNIINDYMDCTGEESGPLGSQE